MKKVKNQVKRCHTCKFYKVDGQLRVLFCNREPGKTFAVGLGTVACDKYIER